jgi:N-acetylglucosaminyl-diphospho-decaprenol L-rhamnosyltransferase
VKTPDLAVQIVNYKSKSFLRSLLNSVLNDLSGTDLQLEINILDNASGDDLQDIEQEFKQNVHVFTATKNSGFGGGHNFLARKTKARYILILNPDMIFIEANTAKRLLATLEKTSAAAVGPKLVTPKNRNNKNLLEQPAHNLKQQLWDHGNYKIFTRFHPLREMTEVDWVSGAVFLVRREAFESVDGFDERFFMYYEDMDICYRLRLRDERIVYQPLVQVLHYGNGSSHRGVRFAAYISASFFKFHTMRLKHFTLKEAPPKLR